MFNPISALNIKHRILVSFGLILIISILFTLFNMLSLRQFHQHFTQFKQVSADTNLMLKIDNNLSELQRQILIFSHNNHVASITELNNIHDKMIADISHLIETHTFEDESNLALLEKMQASVNSFSDKFVNLKDQRNLRDGYIKNKLVNSFTDLDDAMAALAGDVGVEQNKLLIKSLWEAQLGISKAETISADYFNSREFQKKNEVLTHISSADKKLQHALELTNNIKIAQDIKQAIALIQHAKTTFNQTLQADRNYLFLTNIVIAGESAELRILSEQLKRQTLMEQSKLFATTEEGISRNRMIAIHISIISSLIAFTIALITGKFISQPLELISETFGKLAQGKNITKIPGVERADEIGQLARAADVFNKTNLRTKELLHESERMTEELASREHELMKMNEELNNFTHIASHDLKSPIQGIADLTQWVEEDLGTGISEDVKNNLNRIGIRVKRMRGLVDDLLKYSQAGKSSKVKSLIDTNEMIQEILDLLVIPPGIRVDVSGKVAKFEMVKAPLQTTLRNLVANAIKHHNSTEGFIRINVIDEGSNYIFEVQDDGPGIPESDQQSIFLLFQTGSENKESTGMGLAFCKRMVEAHGGRIEVESVVGKGSTFRVFWPKIDS
jgi:signal transduction histidine kinase